MTNTYKQQIKQRGRDLFLARSSGKHTQELRIKVDLILLGHIQITKLL